MFIQPADIPAIQQAAADTAHAVAAGGGSESGSMFGELLQHVYDSHTLDIPFIGEVELPRFGPFHLGGITIDMSITKHVVFLWIAAVILILLATRAAAKNRSSLIPRGIGTMMEALVVFVRDEIVIPNMGTDGIRYMPYLLTTFFFILIMNLAGLVPYGSTATSNVSVTGGLAIIAFVMIQFSTIRAQGLGQYLKHLTGGVHWSLWPIMIPIEILGLFTKPFALMIRLFANMIAGHIVLVSLIGLIFLFHSYPVAPLSVGFALFVNLLEIFVAALQAYIFTMLTSLFMGLGMQHAHEGEEHAIEH